MLMLEIWKGNIKRLGGAMCLVPSRIRRSMHTRKHVGDNGLPTRV